MALVGAVVEVCACVRVRVRVGVRVGAHVHWWNYKPYYKELAYSENLIVNYKLLEAYSWTIRLAQL